MPSGLRYIQTLRAPKNGINRFEKRVYSQNGEDGVIEEIFRRLNVRVGYFVEFGAEDGWECNSAYLARNKDWSGVMIEGDRKTFRALAKHYRPWSKVKAVLARINAENITSILQNAGVPREFDLLSIDIDGNDYWVWQALAQYRARLVVIEYNSSYPPPVNWVMAYDPAHTWDRTMYYGASLCSLNTLGSRLGYQLLGTDAGGTNAFFLRDDCLEQSGFTPLTPEAAFHFGPLFPRFPYRSGPFQEV